ncbi:MAG: class I adenylate-forming enzyme family protein [Pseudomonadota bacterium]|nr:class I adenylate-forming enzyme family protein [Pseudomonadota bacterium]
MSRPTRFTSEMIDAYVKLGYWTAETTLDLMERHAQRQPDKVAIVDPHHRLTWKEVGEVINRFAGVLHALDLDRDTPVIVQLPNSVEDCLMRFALKKLGLLGAYIPVVWGRRELEAVVDVLKPGALIVPEFFRNTDMLAIACDMKDLHPGLQLVVVGPGGRSGDYIRLPPALKTSRAFPDTVDFQARAFGPFEVSKLVVTSGSTGTPKIVERPEQQSLLWGKGLTKLLNLTSEDIVGGFVPFSGGPGYFTWAGWLVSGARLVLSDGFAPQNLLSLIEREQVTVVMTAPAVLARIVDFPMLPDYNVQAVRAVRTGAANLPRAVAEKAEDLLGCLVLKAGGSMETGSFGQISTRDPQSIRLGPSIGKVMEGGEICVVDSEGQALPTGSPGELWVRGPATSSGYFSDREATARAWGTLGPEGWFRTGDIATIDGEGNVSLIGRIKEMINRGGTNIFPVELESLLTEHPKILEAAVVGIPDATLGEVPCLCVLTLEGIKLTLDEVIVFLSVRGLARHKYPTCLLVLEDFPRGQTMRVNRRKLAEQAIAVIDRC